MDNQAYWWEYVAGPSGYIRKLLEGLNVSAGVALENARTLPYREALHGEADMKIHDMNPDVTVDFISGNEVAGKPPADYILGTYGKNGERNMYRASSGESIQSFIRRRKILVNRVLWLYDLTEHQEKEWAAFVSGYEFTGTRDGQFILEAAFRQKKTGFALNHEKEITDYDYLSYNSCLCATLRLTSEQKRYIATMATQIFGERIDLSEEFISEAGQFQEGARAIAERIYRRERLPEFPGLPGSLEKKVWRAQLQVLFPMIEEERKGFIDKYYSEIQEGLVHPHEKNGVERYVMQFNERITDPYDAELGTLQKMTLIKKDERWGNPLLDIRDCRDREWLEMIWHMRNALAHGNCCEDKDARNFLVYAPFF